MNKRALVVDDNEDVRNLVAEILGELDIEVVAKTNGQEALDAFGCENQFDIVVTDLEMPVMNGPALIKTIRSIKPDQPIILVTGNTEELESTAQRYGVVTIGKPFKIADLMKEVSALI